MKTQWGIKSSSCTGFGVVCRDCCCHVNRDEKSATKDQSYDGQIWEISPELSNWMADFFQTAYIGRPHRYLQLEKEKCKTKKTKQIRDFRGEVIKAGHSTLKSGTENTLFMQLSVVPIITTRRQRLVSKHIYNRLQKELQHLLAPLRGLLKAENEKTAECNIDRMRTFSVLT